jgi:hypothetical protein
MAVRTSAAARNSRVESTGTEDGPTPERLRHGPVERPARQIADADGRIGFPHRAVDWLALMAKRGVLTPAMRGAGERYAEDFRVAQLDPLRAAALDRARTEPNQRAPGAPGAAALSARRRLAAAQRALGGAGSPCERGAWHVLGFGRSIREWCLAEGGWLRHETAKGLVIAALSVLAAHYGLDQSRPGSKGPRA